MHVKPKFRSLIDLVIDNLRKPPYFVVVWMSLCLLQTPSARDFEGEINNIIYIENGTRSVVLPCGEVPWDTAAVEWYVLSYYGWNRILKFYHSSPGSFPRYFYDDTSDKYGLSESVNTSFVVKDVELTDTGFFKCSTTGMMFHRYVSLLQVVGELLLTCLVLVIIWICFNKMFLFPPTVYYIN